MTSRPEPPTARSWSRLIGDVIDPVLHGTPFEVDQAGEPSPSSAGGPLPPPVGVSHGSAIWCARYAQVIEAYPHLALPSEEPEEHWCFDLSVDIRDGRLSDVRLEHGDLPDAFRAMGRADDAAAAADLLGRPAEAALPELAVLLARLLRPGG